MDKFLAFLKIIATFLLIGVALPLITCLCVYAFVVLAVASPVIGVLVILYYFWYLLSED